MEEQLQTIWQETLDVLKGKLNTPTFKTWFENTEPLLLEDGTLTVSAPNIFAKEWLESRYGPLLAEALFQVLGSEMRVLFTVDDPVLAPSDPYGGAADGQAGDGPASDGLVTESELGAHPRLLGSGPREFALNPKYSFDSFVTGSSNRFAHAAALAVAEKPSEAYNPLFIYGGVGLGKTHLLQAIAHYAFQHHPSHRVKYVSSEKFTNDFINSIRDKEKIVGFQKRYRNNDILLVDDIQFLEGKEATQEEFFHTFNTLHEVNKQIVISSDRPPKDIGTLEDRLRSRFEWGLITDIQAPDLETRIAILRKKALGENLTVPDPVLEFIASRIQSNIRELEGGLIRVVAFSSLTCNPMSLELAEDVLRDIFPDRETRPISIQTIQAEVCRYFSVSRVDLIGSKRSQSIVYPRQVAMYLSRELTDLSLPKIAEEFGGRDHTTVMYAKSKIDAMIHRQRDSYNQIQELTNRIKQRN